MSTPAESNMRLCYCLTCQQTNPLGVRVTERTFQDHWNAAIHRAAVDYVRHDDDVDIRMDEPAFDNDEQTGDHVQDGDDNIETMTDDVDYDVAAIPSENFFEPVLEVHEIVGENEMNEAADIEFDIANPESDDESNELNSNQGI
ncbi:hypothetical protein BDA99DRAFT_566950 [Phascolomyces articulosus]|uniref:Uncharacterized protein n=1 Tax=Phascolomyces articulosus TaxID=60185 RepID=A0AAD5JJY8_9FUNG|nr:hypothetical protein BDA99DRAFT_566950 [Phascolomyces articulosus]